MANPYCAGSRESCWPARRSMLSEKERERERERESFHSGLACRSLRNRRFDRHGLGQPWNSLRRKARFTGIRSEFNEWSLSQCVWYATRYNPDVKRRRRKEDGRRSSLTCDCESGVPTRDGSSLIPRDAPIYTTILLLLAVHHPQKEQGSRRQ